MKQFYLLPILILLLLNSTLSQAQGTELFENETAGNTTFTEAGFTFNGSTNFDIEFFGMAGSNMSSMFIDNIDSPTMNSTHAISITGGATLFTMQSMEVYVSSFADGSFPTDNGTITVTGKTGGASGTNVFSETKSSSFPTDFSGNNGFFTVDFSNLFGNGDQTGSNIDYIEVTLGGAFQYLAIDDFAFDDEVLATDPPEVQSITLVGTPNSTATTVDFLVTFNKNANNYSN